MPQSLFQQIEQIINDGAAPGCAVVLHCGSKTDVFACGSFNGPGSPAVTPQTVYDLASVSKLFTTALVLRAHERGLLSIHDRCSLYLDNFRGSELTVTDLLTHHVDAGISGRELWQRHPKKAALQQAILAVTPPQRAATKVVYSDIDFVFLGLLLERATGRTLQSLMTELFSELGLQTACTGVDIASRQVLTPPTEVVGGRPVQGMTHDEKARILGGLAGNAGVFAAVSDLAVFGRAWLDDKIIKSNELRAAIFHDYDPSGQNPQALGWWLRYPSPSGHGYSKTPDVYSHTGFTGPILAINPANGNVAAMVCNRTFYGRDNKKHRVVWQLLINWIRQAIRR